MINIMEVDKVLRDYSDLYVWDKVKFIEKIMENSTMDGVSFSKEVVEKNLPITYKLIRENFDDDEILENVVDMDSISDFVSCSRDILNECLSQSSDSLIKRTLENNLILKDRIKTIINNIENEA